LKRREWNISLNARIWRIRNHVDDKMKLVVEALEEEESKEYFTPPQSLDCNEDPGLRSNRGDQYSHRKIL